MSKKKLIFFIVLAGLIFFILFRESEFKPTELGANFKTIVSIKTVRVVNPRFPKLTDAQFDIAMAELKKNISYHLGINVIFNFEAEVDIENFFSEYSKNNSKKEKHIQKFLKKFNLKRIKDKDEDDLYKSLKNQTNSANEHFTFENLLDFYRQSLKPKEQLPSEDISKVGELLNLISNRHFKYFNKIKTIKLNDGKLIFDGMDYHEYLTWFSYLNNYPTYDFIVTNQPLIGIEDPYPTIHSSLRGGVTNGFAQQSKRPYGSTVVMSTFPYLFKHELIQNMRDYDPDSDMTPIYIGSYATHEFGHAYAYWGHYYQHGCIMNPAKALRHKAWHEETRQKENCKAVYEEDNKRYFLRSMTN
ncbi:MAG: hypothetical protein ACQ9MH_11025 [Nitrospinales bacterium]